jgi:outer membrane murein-binding lipoprotein Lpp
MKMRMFLPAALCAVLASLTMTGCTSKPMDELKMAEIAMEQARNMEAQEYEPIDWSKARMQWEEANSLIQMGRYSEARQVLTIAVGTFNTARDKAQRRVESLKIEISALQSEAKAQLKNLEQAVDSSKTNPALRKRIERDLPLIEEKISAMRTAFADKEYLRSRIAGKEALDWMDELQTSAGIAH